jgi:(p)ppGpp synthase/HD superfamily hydrolase
VKPKPTILTTRYTDAVAYATAIHATQVRKGTSVPYIAHLLGVSSLVLEAGGGEDEAIAGLLHDCVEDCGGMAREADVRARFGDRVADIVLGCSDSTDERWKASVGYWTRKRSYLDHLAKADDATLLVSMADKVHNARAIATDLQRYGVDVLEKFNAPPRRIVAYYRGCAKIGKRRGVSMALLKPLRTALDTIEAYVEYDRSR